MENELTIDVGKKKLHEYRLSDIIFSDYTYYTELQRAIEQAQIDWENATEDAIKSVNMEDLSDIMKVRNFADTMGLEISTIALVHDRDEECINEECINEECKEDNTFSPELDKFLSEFKIIKE